MSDLHGAKTRNELPTGGETGRSSQKVKPPVPKKPVRNTASKAETVRVTPLDPSGSPHPSSVGIKPKDRASFVSPQGSDTASIQQNTRAEDSPTDRSKASETDLTPESKVKKAVRQIEELAAKMNIKDSPSHGRKVRETVSLRTATIGLKRNVEKLEDYLLDEGDKGVLGDGNRQQQKSMVSSDSKVKMTASFLPTRNVRSAEEELTDALAKLGNAVPEQGGAELVTPQHTVDPTTGGNPQDTAKKIQQDLVDALNLLDDLIKDFGMSDAKQEKTDPTEKAATPQRQGEVKQSVPHISTERDVRPKMPKIKPDKTNDSAKKLSPSRYQSSVSQQHIEPEVIIKSPRKDHVTPEVKLGGPDQGTSASRYQGDVHQSGSQLQPDVRPKTVKKKYPPSEPRQDEGGEKASTSKAQSGAKRQASQASDPEVKGKALRKEYVMLEMTDEEKAMLQKIIEEIKVMKEKAEIKLQTRNLPVATQSQRPKKSIFSKLFPRHRRHEDQPSNATSFELRRYSREPRVLLSGIPNLKPLKEEYSKTLPELRDRFCTLRYDEAIDTFEAFQKPENRHKVKSSDVICFDSTRVKLNQKNDFIHANYVNAYKKPKAYICCQSPLKATITDFWDMVWQQNSRMIVTPTTIKQSACYWPQGEGNVMSEGVYEIQNMSEEIELNTFISVLHVTNTQTLECREIYHMLFCGWPPKDIPKNPTGFLAFILRCYFYRLKIAKLFQIDLARPEEISPMIVHCRTGTGLSTMFIALDISMHLVDSMQKSNIEEVVRKIRSERAQAVYDFEHYVFIYLALLEYAKFRSYM